MAVPATTGQLRTNIADMEIGDYIACGYIGANGVFNTSTSSNHWLLNRVASEIPVTATNTPNGIFYFIKVDRGLLISDRVVHHSLTWDILNTGKGIQGTPITLGTTIGTIRSLTGGVAYTDENGNLSMTDKFLGGFPINNEWDRYIINFPTDKIQNEKTIDDIFHINRTLNPNIPYTWTQETPTLGFVSANSISATNVHRVVRVMFSGSFVSHLASSTSGNYAGFRPVFQYQE